MPLALFITRTQNLNAITQNTKITSTDINTLITECNNKLNTNGDTPMTGDLNLARHQLLNASCIELSPTTSSGHGGYIDFHYAGESIDYSSRIIETAKGRIDVQVTNGFWLMVLQYVRKQQEQQFKQKQ